mmetsp:Transcript_13534/g.48515  ORF Transcript_13534/g.48515 Transcript_13534/m.48515 type:complete len:200 (-) Transcript_13534:674-1273(-)
MITVQTRVRERRQRQADGEQPHGDERVVEVIEAREPHERRGPEERDALRRLPDDVHRRRPFDRGIRERPDERRDDDVRERRQQREQTRVREVDADLLREVRRQPREQDVEPPVVAEVHVRERADGDAREDLAPRHRRLRFFLKEVFLRILLVHHKNPHAVVVEAAASAGGDDVDVAVVAREPDAAVHLALFRQHHALPK